MVRRDQRTALLFAALLLIAAPIAHARSEGAGADRLRTMIVDDYAPYTFVNDRGQPDGFSVELALEAGTKITRSVVENHRRSREFVRKVFGA